MLRTFTINAIFTVLIILFIFYFYLVLRKIITSLYRYQKRSWRKKVKLAVLQCVKNGDCKQDIFPNRRIVLEVIEELLSDYMNVLKGNRSRKRISEFASHYFTSFYKDRLRHFRFSVRYNTLLMIDKFCMTSLEDELLLILTKKKVTDIERFEIYRILAAFQYKGLKAILCESERLADMVYRDIFHRINDEILQDYVATYETCSKPLQLNLVDVLGDKRDFRALSLLEQLLKEEDMELRIRALKAISKIGQIHNRECILSFTASDSWQERMMAAKVMGAIQSSYFLLPLIRMLSDSSWWVRSTAAQGILRYRKGLHILVRIAETGKDRFARDMAKEWIERVVRRDVS
ncbi:HEAT repeat domain-containing protein [Neobacillus sp. D3-1R]|uniref:HEAT repeat domain-containing protein n=1 Tax=Neobacillus sp. D3-1R TaxID=3445778 RepID=UPI003F9EECDD